MQGLTERQEEVLSLIKEQVEQGRPFPSLREIAELLGVRHKSGISGHLKALERKGYIERHMQRVSDFKLTAPLHQDEQAHFSLVARIPAGTPLQAFEDESGDDTPTLQFNHPYFGGGQLLAVTIQGESMAGDAICDGDIAIIKLQNEANRHDIVAVRLNAEDEVTLKRLSYRPPMVDLLPSNPAYPVRSVPAQQVTIIGKLVGIVRKT